MKLLAVIFCLVVSVNAFGQGKDTIGKDSMNFVFAERPFKSQVIEATIILDNAVYKGGLNSINPDAIVGVAIFKGNPDTAKYDSLAVAGVIVIRTNKYQKDEPVKKISPLDSVVGKNALYVVNGELSKNKLNDVNPNDILNIDILKEGKGSNPSLELINNVVVVVTKSYAVEQYQRNFSAFSKEYKSYLETHQGDGKGFFYIINGVSFNQKKNEDIAQLYNLSKDNIRRVDFRKEEPNERGITAMVLIATKN